MHHHITNAINGLSQKAKTKLVFLGDGFGCYIAYFLTVVFTGTQWSITNAVTAMIFVATILGSGYIFRMYSVVWDLFSFRDLKVVFLATFLSSTLIWIGTNNQFQIHFYVLLSLLSFGAISATRLFYSNWRSLLFESVKRQNIVIIGAGEAGAQAFTQIIKSPNLQLNPVGFLDDALDSQGRRIHGLPVLGKISELEKIKDQLSVSKVLVAIPSASKAELAAIYRLAIDARLEVSTLPALEDILNGRLGPSSIKEVELEDLLMRDYVNLDRVKIEQAYLNKIIMVTGAGGSIGSELCHQIGYIKPDMVILFEQTEWFLYELERKLVSQFPSVEFISVIGDVRDYASLESVVVRYKPDFIFHAAAYKHVPLVERNPAEAIVTNVIGTTNAAMVAAKHGVSRFVLISTDKAVNPTSIMGATKRVAEISCQICAEDNPDTKFMIVRFGNVLGSSGSVIPLFKSQIAAGGPVTVTHRDVVRYFMSIPEASQLVMLAGAIGNGGELFVLDMGDLIKIYDLATDLIKLSGFTPGEDMQIEITGLRPGEKLYEELLADKETTIETNYSKIKIARCIETDDIIREQMRKIQLINRVTDPGVVIAALQALVPDFKHASSSNRV